MSRKSPTASRPGSANVLFLVPRANSNCTSIAKEANINQSTIQSLNPGVDCTSFRTRFGKSEAYESSYFVTTGSGTLPDGPLCTRQYTPKCTLNATATEQTCKGLADKSNISTTDFVKYNDNVGDTCANLTVGQPVRRTISAKRAAVYFQFD